MDINSLNNDEPEEKVMLSDEEKEEQQYEIEAEENADSFKSEPVLSFQYDVKNEEEDRAFRCFQKRYVYPHNWKVTAAFGVVVIAFLVSIIRNPGGYLNYVLMFISLFVIALTWYNSVRIRKYLLKALKVIEDDKYRFTLYETGFEIETIVSDEERNSEEFVEIKPKRVRFSEYTNIEVIENDEMFIIVIKSETNYVLCKRVLDPKQIETLRDELSGELGADYHLITSDSKEKKAK